jgi:hypothetical protein
VATEGIQGLHVETRNYGATAAFWASLGFKSTFETDHGSGQWVHPAGGPYVFRRLVSLEAPITEGAAAPDDPGRREEAGE